MAGVWSSVRVQRRWQAVALPSVFRQSGSSKFVSARTRSVRVDAPASPNQVAGTYPRRKNDSLRVTTGRGWHARGGGSIAYSCELLAAPCPASHDPHEWTAEEVQALLDGAKRVAAKLTSNRLHARAEAHRHARAPGSAR